MKNQVREEILLSGLVKKGCLRGRELGFPTLNLHLTAGEPPEAGVYAAFAFIDNVKYDAVVHYGPRPTLQEVKPVFEVHLIGGSGDFYGKMVSVKILGKIRDIQKFSSPEMLKAQIMRDIETAQSIYFSSVC